MNDKDKRQIDETSRSDAAESAFQRHGDPQSVEDNRDRRTEKKIDHSLKETFPASDPPAVSPGAD